MPFSGGTYSRTDGTRTGATVWVQAKAGAVKILAADHDTHDQDIATALNALILRDGTNVPTADLPMGGQKHTGVGNATATAHYAAAGQVRDNALTYAADTGAADAYAIAPTIAISAYAAGQRFSFLAAFANTGASTLNVSALGTKAIQKNGAALIADDIGANDIVVCEYDGTQFQMTSPSGNINSATTVGLAVLTAANEAAARTAIAGAAASQELDGAPGFINGGASEKDYRFIVKAPHGGTITETTTRSVSGTCTATFKINTTALGGTANAVSTTEQSQAHASANVFVAGDDLVLTVSSNSGCRDVSFMIKYTRVLD